MKYAALLLLLVGCSKPGRKAPEYSKVDPATAAKVTGEIRFSGKAPASKLISMDAEEACVKLHDQPVSGSTVVTGKAGALANAFVYIKSGLEGKAFEPPKQAVMLDQKGCMFVPRVVALQTGQTLTVKNSDPVSHNVHPRAQVNREWNQQQSPGAPDLQRRFAKPEVLIPVKCNIHSWMRSYIAVLDHPFFSVTDDGGNFVWPTVPPGQYVIAVWHESLGEQSQTVELTPKGEAKLQFTFR